MKALLDTNIVIYLQKGVLAEALPEGQYAISIITEMELLSFPGLKPEQKNWLNRWTKRLRRGLFKLVISVFIQRLRSS